MVDDKKPVDEKKKKEQEKKDEVTFCMNLLALVLPARYTPKLLIKEYALILQLPS